MRLRLLTFSLSLLLSVNAFAQLDKILAPVDLALAAPSSSLERQSAQKDALHLLTFNEALPQLQQQLADRFPVNGELKIQAAAPWGRILVPTTYQLTIVDYPGAGLSSAFVVRCKLTADGQGLGEFQIPLRAEVWREVWVTEGRLDRGQTLDRSLLTAQKVDVLRERETLLSSDVDPGAFDVAQSVAAGRPLTRRDVAERPVIHKGDVVDVIAHQGAFSIRMKAQALENGIARELIKMRNIESRKDFNAQVINESEVEVHL
jgi:flagella basal body P-ring formation protein FlgA